MNVHLYAWIITVAVMLAILAFDVFIIGRRPHEPSMKEAGTAIGIFVGLAVAFGLAIWAIAGPRYAGEFFAGWLTEYSLSVDNLFIFLIIMTKSQGAPAVAAVRPAGGHHPGADLPRHLHRRRRRGDQSVQLGVLHLRRVPALHRGQAGPRLPQTRRRACRRTTRYLRFVNKRFPSTDDYHGTKLTVVENGKRLITPMLVVIIALGSTDLLFALDSIPAIYGLTQEPYLVFTANVFALMGLRQLYFLLGGLLRKLVYLSIGLSVILAFIGVKLVFHAMHEYHLDEKLGIPFSLEIPIWLSLSVIIGTLTITTVASLVKSRYDEDRAPVEEPSNESQTSSE